MRAWIMCGAALLLSGTLLGAFSGCGHHPNHDIDMEEARKAADRVHARPAPGVALKPGHGG